jgi:tRNA threonylcarbamoyladenosine biosynthesis protein TsaE
MEQDLLKYVITTHEEMIELGKLVGACAYANMVVTLDGDLGAGKTTFTKGFAETLGVKK